jgi:hypothetical protein
MNPRDACVVVSGVGADATPALRLSVVADRTVPSATHRRTGTLLTAQQAPSQLQGLRRFPSLAHPSFPHRAPPPEPGSSPCFSVVVGVDTSRFTRAAQHPHSKRAASQAAPELPSPHQFALA